MWTSVVECVCVDRSECSRSISILFDNIYFKIYLVAHKIIIIAIIDMKYLNLFLYLSLLLSGSRSYKIISSLVKKDVGLELQDEPKLSKFKKITSMNMINSELIASALPNKTNIKGVVAQSLGILMGGGAMVLYTPILIKLWKAKNGEGLSFQTWVFNLLGFTAAVLYPLKKGFPISTYIEGIALCLQSLLILGTLSLYKGAIWKFLIALFLYASSLVFLAGPVIPVKYVSLLQLAATISCNYAQIPQIVLSYKLKKSSWSIISATMSTVGNLIRVFTTITLTKDPLILYGHVVGAMTNAILLLQIILYSKK